MPWVEVQLLLSFDIRVRYKLFVNVFGQILAQDVVHWTQIKEMSILLMLLGPQYPWVAKGFSQFACTIFEQTPCTSLEKP